MIRLHKKPSWVRFNSREQLPYVGMRCRNFLHEVGSLGPRIVTACSAIVYQKCGRVMTQNSSRVRVGIVMVPLTRGRCECANCVERRVLRAAFLGGADHLGRNGDQVSGARL